MKRPELPIPASVIGFTVKQAVEARAQKGRLRAKDLVSPTRGIRLRATEANNSFALALALCSEIHGSIVSHVSAAQFWGIPLPQTLGLRRVIHIARKFPAAPPRRPGVIGHKLRIDRAEITQKNGLWLTTPARTWADLAGLLSEEDLVVAGDYLVRSSQRGHRSDRQPLCTIEDLTANLRPGTNGNKKLRNAVSQVRPGVDSPQETRLRLAAIKAGLPEPRVNFELCDPMTDQPVRWGDLAYPNLKIVIQYEGDFHRSKTRYAADILRDEEWQNPGWTVVRISSTDMINDAFNAVAKIRRAIEAAAGLATG